MTDRPRDEFDNVPETSARQGVHRERLIPAQSASLGLKITVVILALLLALGAYFILPRLGLTDGSDDDAAPSSSTSSPVASASQGESDAAGPDDSDDAEASASATADDDADAVDRSQTVNVLNGTGTPGLSSVAADQLETAGWTSVLPGNWAGAPVDASVVFYNGEGQRASAETVAEDLDITNLVDAAEVSADISVVLGPEFP